MKRKVIDGKEYFLGAGGLYCTHEGEPEYFACSEMNCFNEVKDDGDTCIKCLVEKADYEITRRKEEGQ